MSHAALRSNIRGMVREMLSGLATVRIGILTDYDPNRPAVKVNLMPDEIETGWIPLRTCLAGPSFGVFVGPTAGLEAVVLFQEGSIDVGICIGFLGNDEDVPPSVPAGQMLLVDSNGSSLAFTNDKKLTLTDGAGSTVAMTGDNKISLSASAGVFINGIRMDTHKHTGVQSGSSETGAPTNT